jgi:DNA uptake protein ComE-like DNA-binding protein
MSRSAHDSYLYFTRKERRGSLLLLLVVVLVTLTPFFFSLLNPKIMSTPHELDENAAALKTRQAVARKSRSTKNFDDDNVRPYDNSSPGNYSPAPPSTPAILFNFDPNTISVEDWKKLGLRDKTISTIQNYLSKGGRFRDPADIKKIWGLFPDEAERLMPYVHIEKPAGGSENKKFNGSSQGMYPAKSSAPVLINDADTAAWIGLPGIGSTLSNRIVRFRDKLGGFYSVEQVAETFGLPDSTFQQIKPLLQLAGEVKKININAATLEELKNHPYIKHPVAKALVEYRVQHGEYKEVADIKKIMIVTEELYTKLSPYFSVD